MIDAPRWWDEHGVPRYCAPDPQKVANIYAREVAFVRIACQVCGREFLVAHSRYPGGDSDPSALAKRIADRELWYGDPPNVGCCAPGPTMNSVPLRVEQYWHRTGHRKEWERDRNHEVDFGPAPPPPPSAA